MFTCQKCRYTLLLNAEAPLEESAILSFVDESRSPRHLTQEFREQEQKAVDFLSDSFVVLPSRPGGKIKNPGSKNLDRQVRAITNIFQIASDKTQVDHPLCSQCSTEIAMELETQLRHAQSEHQQIQDTYDSLMKNPQFRALQAEEAARAAEAGEASRREEEEEAALLKKLVSLRKKRKKCRGELQQLQKDWKALDAFEDRFWKEFQNFQMELHRYSNDQRALKARTKHAYNLLERLKRTNVYDDVFHISYDGHFATINGFRLGRLPSQNVEWVETNAAMGQIVLLLHTIAEQCQFKFSKHRLIPMGSFSKMSPVDDPRTAYELYGSNNLTFGTIFWFRRYDPALTWLLQCIKELGDYAAKQDINFNRKYPINKDKIGGVSIKLQFNPDHQWTRALKYMLTTLKFLLVWIATRPRDDVAAGRVG